MNPLGGLVVGVALLAWGCRGNRDLAGLPPYPEAFQREWFDAQRDLAKGDADEAYAKLANCALMEPDEPAIPFQMGKIDGDAERHSAALVHLNRAIALGGNDPWMRHYRALSLLALQDVTEAAKDVLYLVDQRTGDIDYALEWIDLCRRSNARELAVAVCDRFEERAAPDPEISQARLSLISATAKPDAVLRELERMVDRFPDIVEFRAYLASFLTEHGNANQAFDVLTTAEAIDPYNGRVQFELGSWYVGMHNDKKAVHHYTRAFGSDDVEFSEVLTVLNHFHQFLYSPVASAPLRPLLAAALAAHGGQSALFLMAADVALADGDVRRAQEFTQEAVEAQPHRIDGWRRLVAFDAQLEDWEALARDAEAGVARFPVDPELLLHAGMASKALGNPADAVVRCEQARANLVANNPELKFRIHLVLGDALNASGRPLEAAEVYDVLVQMSPDNATLWNNQAWYYAQAEVHLDRALAAIQRAVELEPGVAIFEDTYAWVLHVSGDHAGASSWIERAIASDGGGGTAGMWENAGDIYRALGDLENMLRSYGEALQRGANAERIRQKMNAAS